MKKRRDPGPSGPSRAGDPGPAARGRAGDLVEVLSAVAAGKLSVATAQQQLADSGQLDIGFARFDLDRQRRTGVPEVIFAAGKTAEQLVALVGISLERHGRVLATRVDDTQAHAVCAEFPKLSYQPISQVLRSEPGAIDLPKVAVLSAGTSDQRVAEEAAEVLTHLGHDVDRFYDVGVAGIHRLFNVLERMRTAHALVVAAGMEGALPSVVAGLVERPVVAVPTSVGYGASFGGVAALLAMLNSCAAGVGVVNIDNGFGAAMLAHRMARKATTQTPTEAPSRSGKRGEAAP